MKFRRIQIYLSLGFLFLMIGSDQMMGNLFKYLYFNQKTGPGYHLNYIFSKCNSDILIFGNSRAQHHYNPQIIADSSNLSCFNAGIDGGHSIILANAQIKIILKRYLPKIIIIELDPSAMDKRKDEYDRFSILLPFYHVYKELEPLILKRSPWESIKLLSAIYPYNSQIINLVRFNTNLDENRNWIFDGYIPIKNKQINNYQYKEPDIIEDNSSADPEKLKALEETIQLCNDEKIKLYFFNSPIFNTVKSVHKYDSKSTKQVMEIIENNKTTYLDFSNDAQFNGQFSFFADRLHLNEIGAKKYSQIVGEKIKQNLYRTMPQ